MPAPPAYKLLHEIAPAQAGQGDSNPATGPIYRAAYAAEGLGNVDSTCFDLFKNAADKFGSRPCLGWRTRTGPEGQTLGPYTFMTYKEAWDKSVKVGSAFLELGLQPKGRVGVFGGNCPEWMLAMQGCNRTSMECVPLYDTLGENAIDFILNHAEVQLVVASAAKLPALLRALERFEGQLLAIAYWGGPPEDEGVVEAIKSAGVPRVLSFEELLELGAANPREAIPPTSKDISTIMYTSGTTGDPKGVIHTHASVASTVESIRQFLDHNKVGLSCDDVYFSFLPLAHIFDRVVEEAMIMLGASVGYFAGDTRKLLDDCAVLQPTVFCAVPRVFERVYAGVMDKVKQQGGFKLALFNAALGYKQFWMRMGWKTTAASPLCNKVFFSQTQAAVGGRMRLFISGGAPLPTYAGSFMATAMNVPVLQGYGLTETCGATIGQDPFDHSMMGTVGLPLPGIDMRLEAVPELGYLPTDDTPRGEVCLRGPIMFSGYHKQPDLTTESTDKDGFFHTGDIGELTPQGALRIIDRKKNIFKLSQGEYVAVEFIESILGKSSVVEQIWVYGSSFESVLVTVVVPKQAALMTWAKEQGGDIADKDFAELCATPEATHFALEDLVATGKAARLKGFEFPKAIHLEPHAFSIEHDLITPKMSLKRPQLLKYYKTQVEGMYARLKHTGQAAPSKKAPTERKQTPATPEAPSQPTPAAAQT